MHTQLVYSMKNPEATKMLRVPIVLLLGIIDYLYANEIVRGPSLNLVQAGDPFDIVCCALQPEDSNGVRVRFGVKTIYQSYPMDWAKKFNVAKYELLNPHSKTCYEIRVKHSSIDDAGIYSCELIKGNGGTAWKNETIVFKQPVIRLGHQRKDGINHGSCRFDLHSRLISEAEKLAVAVQIGEEKVEAKTQPLIKHASGGTFTLQTAFEYQNLRKYNDQILRCEVSTPKSAMTVSAHSRLTIHYKLTSTKVVPWKEFYDLGEIVHCYGDANPPPEFTWSSSTTDQSFKGEHLVINREMKQKDTWRCTITAGDEEAVIPIIIKIKQTPIDRIDITPEQESYKIGDTLTCKANGYPPPEYHWKSHTTPEITINGPYLHIDHNTDSSVEWECTACEDFTSSNMTKTIIVNIDTYGRMIRMGILVIGGFLALLLCLVTRFKRYKRERVPFGEFVLEVIGFSSLGLIFVIATIIGPLQDPSLNDMAMATTVGVCLVILANQASNWQLIPAINCTFFQTAYKMVSKKDMESYSDDFKGIAASMEKIPESVVNSDDGKNAVRAINNILRERMD